MTVDLREVYRSQEHLVDGATDRLLPAVRARRRRRKIKTRMGYASIALLVAATIVGVTSLGPSHPAAPTPPDTSAPVTSHPPSDGGRVESSLGMEIEVPVAWQTNDFGCSADGQPTVVRAQEATGMCLSLLTEEYAIISDFIGVTVESGLGHTVPHKVIIDGVAATRASGPISGGRFGGWIVVKSRDVAVVVVADSQALLSAILDSTHLVTIDHFGCATAAPRPTRPAPPPDPTFADPAPAAVSVCYYAGAGRLQTSAQRTGAAAASLMAAFNAAKPGRNRDHPQDCEHSSGPQKLDAVMLIYPADGAVQRVNATFSSCVGVDLDNGRSYRVLTRSLVGLIMDGTYSGYDMSSAVQ